MLLRTYFPFIFADLRLTFATPWEFKRVHQNPVALGGVMSGVAESVSGSPLPAFFAALFGDASPYVEFRAIPGNGPYVRDWVLPGDAARYATDELAAGIDIVVNQGERSTAGYSGSTVLR